MKEISLLAKSKETTGKLRWAAEVDAGGPVFSLYIPKDRVPEPWPGRIQVEVWASSDPSCPRDLGRVSNDDPIVEDVHWVKDHTETARYCPAGHSSDWLLGEPYIPFELLPEPAPERVVLRVRWDRSSPWVRS